MRTAATCRFGALGCVTLKLAGSARVPIIDIVTADWHHRKMVVISRHNRLSQPLPFTRLHARPEEDKEGPASFTIPPSTTPLQFLRIFDADRH